MSPAFSVYIFHFHAISDYTVDIFSRQIGFQIGNGDVDEAGSRFPGDPRDMRRYDAVWKTDQGVAVIWRFDRKDVKTGRKNLPRFQSLRQIFFVDQRTSGGVEQDDPVLHF